MQKNCLIRLEKFHSKFSKKSGIQKNFRLGVYWGLLFWKQIRTNEHFAQRILETVGDQNGGGSNVKYSLLKMQFKKQPTYFSLGRVKIGKILLKITKRQFSPAAPNGTSIFLKFQKKVNIFRASIFFILYLWLVHFPQFILSMEHFIIFPSDKFLLKYKRQLQYHIIADLIICLGLQSS